MDDELYIRDLMSDMLASFGYSVEVARDGNEAIELFRKRWLRITPSRP